MKNIRNDSDNIISSNQNFDMMHLFYLQVLSFGFLALLSYCVKIQYIPKGISLGDSILFIYIAIGVAPVIVLAWVAIASMAIPQELVLKALRRCILKIRMSANLELRTKTKKCYNT